MANISLIFKIIIVVIIYCIIVYALKIMYNDMKNDGRKKRKKRIKFGLEIVERGENQNLQNGSVVPMDDYLTIGRAEDNLVSLSDKYVSSHHLKIYIRNNEYILEDLGSTNGTFVNDRKINGKVIVRKGDKIKVGSSIFKVIIC